MQDGLGGDLRPVRLVQKVLVRVGEGGREGEGRRAGREGGREAGRKREREARGRNGRNAQASRF